MNAVSYDRGDKSIGFLIQIGHQHAGQDHGYEPVICVPMHQGKYCRADDYPYRDPISFFYQVIKKSPVDQFLQKWSNNDYRNKIDNSSCH